MEADSGSVASAPRTTASPGLSSGSSSGTEDERKATFMDQIGAVKDSRKVVHNASSKVSLVVQRMLLPIIQTPLRSHVVFDVEEDQLELDLIEQLGKKNPEVLDDTTGLTFIQHLQGLFDRYRWWRSPSGAYSRVAVCPSSSRRMIDP